MQINKTTVRSITFLMIYAIFVLLIFMFNEDELRDRATCCGLYNYYYRYYLPFPIIKSSALSHWGGGPTRFLNFYIAGNIAIPVTIFLIPQLVTKLKKININNWQQ